MADAPKLLGTDTLRQAYPKLNSAIDNSNSALTTATTAKSTADTAKSTAETALANSENTQTQLDTIVINGDSSVEAAQARIDADGNSFTTLQERLNNSDTQLTDAQQKELLHNIRSKINKAFDHSGSAPSINFVGDSFTEGVGATIFEASYLSLIHQGITKITNQGKGSGYITDTNFFDENGFNPFNLIGSYSFGVNGPIKKSLILQPGASVTFSAIVNFVEIFFHRTPSSGSIQIYKNGGLVRTINCSGTDDLLAMSNLHEIPDSDALANYEVRCVNAPVELFAITRWRKNNGNDAIYLNSFAVSSTTTEDFTSDEQLNIMNNIATMKNTFPAIFIIALGTNDIYNASKSVSSQVYQSNLRLITEKLLTSGADVVLTIPPKADIPVAVEPHKNYRRKALDLAKELNVPLVDLSSLELAEEGWLLDGVHPNNEGHYAIAQLYLESLNIPKVISTEEIRKKITVEIADFVDDSGNKRYENANLNNVQITGVYIRNKTNGAVVPYHDYTDYQNNIGLEILRAYSTLNFRVYYNPAGGFCKVKGVLGGFLTNTPSNAQMIIEYID